MEYRYVHSEAIFVNHLLKRVLVQVDEHSLFLDAVHLVPPEHVVVFLWNFSTQTMTINKIKQYKSIYMNYIFNCHLVT